MENSFAYKAHYAEMVESVNKYNGFFVGRYEVTIDENNNIGSKYNTEVIKANKIIPQTNNKECRWHGLYYVERNSNVVGNKDYVQTNMVWGQQWDKMLEYFDSKSLNYTEFGNSKNGKGVNLGQSINNNNENDKIYNIYDLRTNYHDWTAEALSNTYRSYRGGNYYSSYSASYRYRVRPDTDTEDCSSRLTLYIK